VRPSGLTVGLKYRLGPVVSFDGSKGLRLLRGQRPLSRQAQRAVSPFRTAPNKWGWTGVPVASGVRQ